MESKGYFDDFMGEISLPASVRARCVQAHNTLRSRLMADPDLSEIIVALFLQGSYKRGTINRGVGDKKPDVDLVVVTTLDARSVSPAQAHDRFTAFLDKYYPGKWKQQGRSLGIELDSICLDLVITAAPSEAVRDSIQKASWVMDAEVTAAAAHEERYGDLTALMKSSSLEAWRTEPLLIPDREANRWDQTHPLAQLAWTVEKNLQCNRFFLRVVRVLKWWKHKDAADLDHPKSYPWEHLIGDCCPSGITSIATGVTLTLEQFVQSYQADVAAGRAPESADRGIASHNVMKHTDPSDFAAFYQLVFNASVLARQALDCTDREESAHLWSQLFGTAFPAPAKKAGFTERTDKTTLRNAQFA